MGNTVENLYSYHEVQYDKDEYIKLVAETGINTEINTLDLTEQTIDNDYRISVLELGL